MKNVQIPYGLFFLIVKYHLLDMHEDNEKIKKGLENKIDRMARHKIYTKSKTAPTEEEREKSRKEYLDMAGMHQNFRW